MSYDREEVNRRLARDAEQRLNDQKNAERMREAQEAARRRQEEEERRRKGGY
jgi:hypothetical protein